MNIKKQILEIAKTKTQNLILIITGVILFCFSLIILFQIEKLNGYINNSCEKRYYTDWTKEEKILLTPGRETILRDAYLQCEKSKIYIKQAQQKEIDENPFLHLGKLAPFIPLSQLPKTIQIAETKCLEYGGDLKIEESLSSKYETKIVPDEEKRDDSKKEVEDYKRCLSNQNFAIKDRPEKYKFLLIVDFLILILGAIFFFALKKSEIK